MATDGDFPLFDRVVLVTGGDKGLGLQLSNRLLQGGAKLLLACRDPQLFTSCDKARLSLYSRLECKNSSPPELIHMDMDSLSGVQSAVEIVKAKVDKVDTLVCNAGVMLKPGIDLSTKDGLELQVGVNHLAHFHLVQLLLPLLKCSTDPRVVIVSSILLKQGTLLLDYPSIRSQFYQARIETKSRTSLGYCDSKLMNALFAHELSRREPTISVFCVSPGWVRATKLGRHTTPAWYSYPALVVLLALFSKHPTEGVDSVLFCAAAREQNVKHLRGKFVRSRKVEGDIETMLQTLNDKICLLWQASEQIIGELTSK